MEIFAEAKDDEYFLMIHAQRGKSKEEFIHKNSKVIAHMKLFQLPLW